jgi:[pyruvate, water dikinase]-phosphate phosphotransferase / [pyruvate, water dikinase] kinase
MSKTMSAKVAQPRRAALSLSDRTGITVEMLEHSLLRQFEDVPFDEITLPYLDTAQKASADLEQINERARTDGCGHLCSAPSSTRRSGWCWALRMRCTWIASAFYQLIEAELGVRSSPFTGLSHHVVGPCRTLRAHRGGTIRSGTR